VKNAEDLRNTHGSETEKPSAKRLFTVKQAACYLAMAPKTLYNLAYARRIPTVKLGRSLRFDLKDLDDLIAANRRPT